MLLRMRIERWAAWCRGRWPLWLGVTALVLQFAGTALVGGGCEYVAHDDGTKVAVNALFQPGTSGERGAYRLLSQLQDWGQLPLAFLWLVLLIPALWSRVVGSARIVFVLTLVAAVTWGAMLAQYMLTMLPTWLELGTRAPELTMGMVNASFVAMEWSRLAMWVSAGLLVAGFPAAGVRWLYTWVKSGPVKVQA